MGSTDILSANNTSPLITSIVRWFKPDISRAALNRIHHIVRKGGHVTEYAVLSILIWRAWPKPAGTVPNRHHWALEAIPIAVATLYAVTDEYHQSFYRSRTPSAGDVMIDCMGAALGIGLIWLYYRFRRHQSSTG